MNFNELNPEQEQAVRHIDGPLLLLAGAGSGKTKVLTMRLAYLIKEVGILPSSILCLTFTNKASQEMKERALKLIEHSVVSYPLLCTFHKFGLFFLKKYIFHLNRPLSFVLLDVDDVKKIIKSFKSPLATSMIMGYISYYKNQALTPQEVLNGAKSKEFKTIAELYWQYQDCLESKNLLDFDDLLFLTYRILEQNPVIAQEVSDTYQYIMVDEYQDTNLLQYKLLRLLASSHQNLCVVGDEDQSIYSWRGADIRNILEFEKDFNKARVIKLERNYRSTPQILSFANNLISCNTQRLGKTLRSMQNDGEKVQIKGLRDEREEIEFVAQRIQKLLVGGVNHEEIAILYRLNAMSRIVEEGLNRAKIPYRLIGAVRFYERSEVKDLLSYLRLMVNKSDDFSLFRVLNKPKRGVGKTSQAKLEESAKGMSVYELLCTDCAKIAPKIVEILREFFSLIDELSDTYEKSIEEFVALFGRKVALLEEYHESEREDRGANLDELFGLLREFREKNPESNLEDFLNELSLSSDADGEYQGSISCMSMHSSKGLEFDYVFVIGCEEGMFPLFREGENMEEERRLGYVAFTRARKQLFLSYVTSRFYKGKRQILAPSRFLKEALNGKESGGEIVKNSLVKHKVFGMGRVQEISGKGDETKAKVNFGGNERVILVSFLECIP